MYECSIENKEEPLRLLQYNKVLLAVCKLIDLENEIELLYAEAANLQGNTKCEESKIVFDDHICKIVSDLNEMAEVMTLLRDFAHILKTEEDYSGDEVWWTQKACEELKRRAAIMGETEYANWSLVSYSRYIRLDPEIPASRITHPTGRALIK